MIPSETMQVCKWAKAPPMATKKKDITEQDREPHLRHRAEVRRGSYSHVLLKFLGMSVSLVKHQMM